MFEKDNLKVIYEILKKVESVQDEELVNPQEFSVEIFQIEEPRYIRLIDAMQSYDLVKGFEEYKRPGDKNISRIARNPSLTMRGMEYLSYYSAPETFIRRIQQFTGILK